LLNLPALKRINVAAATDPGVLARQLMQFIQYLVTSVDPLLARPRAVSSVQSVDLIAATPKVISHRLGQTPLGWLITDIDTNTTVRRNAWDDRTITLQAAANCTVQLEVW
jgi:hypothetical protein